MPANANANGSSVSTRTARKPSALEVKLAEMEARAKAAEERAEAAEKVAAEATAKAAAKKSGTGTYLDYATKDASPAIVQFLVWLNREFPEQFPTATDATQLKIVDLAIKTYSWYQKSDISYKATKAAKAK